MDTVCFFFRDAQHSTYYLMQFLGHVMSMTFTFFTESSALMNHAAGLLLFVCYGGMYGYMTSER